MGNEMDLTGCQRARVRRKALRARVLGMQTPSHPRTSQGKGGREACPSFHLNADAWHNLLQSHFLSHDLGEWSQMVSTLDCSELC